MHDYDFKEPLPVDIGVGVEFEHRGYRAITLPRERPWVSWRITSFRGTVPWAIHYYGTLNVTSLQIKILKIVGKEARGHCKVGDVFGTNVFDETLRKYPDLKWMDGFSIDITYVLEEDFQERGDKYVWPKGSHYSRFADFFMLKQRIEEEYLRLFGKKWTLCHGWTTEKGLEVLRKYQRGDV